MGVAAATGELGLRADCARCFGLCCVGPAFARSADFPIDKPAGRPCPNLADDSRCGVHDELRPRGFVGCTVFDCFGAGQRVSQHTFASRDWRTHPDLAADMFASLGIVRQLHELLWYLGEALALDVAAPTHPELRRLSAAIERDALAPPARLRALDLDRRRAQVGTLLGQASQLARTGRANKDWRGHDLVGRNLGATDLRAANLRGSLLIGANLAGADLRGADLLGADLRGANLAGADLTGTLFLIQSQLTAANGDPHTRLSRTLTRPAHWTGR